MTAPSSGPAGLADTAIRPILASSCARASTAAEARFRIDAPISGRKAARVIALDAGAAAVLDDVAELPWNGAHFFAVTGPTDDAADLGDLADQLRRIELRGIGGPDQSLADALQGADVAVMVVTAGSSAPVAAAVGYACFLDGIMTAGLILDQDGGQLAPTVTGLRPHARVILVTSDAQDVTEVLTALRA